MNPYVFVVGCPRSGTTLLRRLLDAHPQLAITRETHWIPELAAGRDGSVGTDLLAALAAHPKFRTLELDAAELEPLVNGTGPVSYADFVTAVFDLYGKRRGKRLVGDKTPSYARELAGLHRLWPAARFVHLIRDGRDVCVSALAWERKAEELRRRFRTWAEDPATSAALWWRSHVEPARREGSRLGPSLYHELRYETLVADPEGECRRLCAFLEVRYEEAMLRYHEGRVRIEPGLSAKRAWLPPTRGLRDWRRELPVEALERVEAAAGALLHELGYERAVARTRPERLAHAARLAAEFDADTQALMGAR